MAIKYKSDIEIEGSLKVNGQSVIPGGGDDVVTVHVTPTSESGDYIILSLSETEARKASSSSKMILSVDGADQSVALGPFIRDTGWGPRNLFWVLETPEMFEEYMVRYRLYGTFDESQSSYTIKMSVPYTSKDHIVWRGDLDAYSKIEIVDVPNNQTTFDGKVFPNIFNDTANRIYDYYTSGKTVIVKWTVLGIPVEATVISSDKIGTTKTFDLIMHNEYLCEYSTTEGSTDGFATVTFVKLGGGGNYLEKGTESGNNSTATHGATASGNSSVAIGYSASADTPYQVAFPHIKLICCGDLPSEGYTVPTGYTAIMFDVTDGSIGIKTAGQSIDARHEDFAIIVKAEA